MNNEKPRLWTRNFVLIIVINFLVFMNHIMLLSTFPFYIESLGGSEALAGLAATLFSLVAVLCRPFVGWMLDNGKRRAILLAGLAGMLLMPLGYMFAAFLLLALAPNTVTFILAAVLAGYGFGGLEPALQSMAVHSAAPAERGSANSTFLCAYDIGIGLGGGIAGVLISGLGYEQMFVILSAANIVSVLLYVLWGRNDPSSISRSLRIAKDGEKNA